MSQVPTSLLSKYGFADGDQHFVPLVAARPSALPTAIHQRINQF